MCFSKTALFMMLTLLPLSASAEWLEFGTGCSENSAPRTFHDITLEDLVCFDVELSGLLADTVLHDSIPYLRLHQSPGTTTLDSMGFPELPTVVCFVAIPDEADLDLSYTANCPETLALGLPIYPAPMDSLVCDSNGSTCIAEFFRKDSTAYASEDWYPEELAEIRGEFHLRDQRVAIVAIHPVQYLASGDSLRVWGDLELSVLLDGEDLDWNEDGLGYYDLLIGDMLLGYHPDYKPIDAPQPQVVRHTSTTMEPSIDPDYVILVADGLDGAWIDRFARYRRDLSRFDVLIANLDDVMTGYGGNEDFLTPDILRDYTEALWAWTTPATRPTYLLLIGDHEDEEYAEEGWFLPAFQFYAHNQSVPSANDSWYTCFDESREQEVSFPDMIVGRLSARDPGDLQDMLGLVETYEAAAESPYPEYLQYRRDLTRLIGRPGGVEGDDWRPEQEWTSDLCSWMDYTMHDYYCGDGDPYTSDDGSAMSSRQWIEACTEEFERGSQILFYSDHGSVHYFECGLNEESSGGWYGQSDSTFDDLEVEALCETGMQSHLHPFVLLFSCSQNTFNWTEWQQYHEVPHWNYYNDLPGYPQYDFGVDCFAEDLMLNTEGGAIGVFGASWASSSTRMFNENLLVAPYHFGQTRIGDAVQAARLSSLQYFVSSQRYSWDDDLGLFNLLGDPAVDIGDRMKFPDCCDLIVSPADLEINAYPTMDITGHGEVLLHVTVRNAGGSAAGEFDVDLEITDESSHEPDVITRRCPGLAPGEERTLEYAWTTHGWFDPPGMLVLTATVEDPGNQHPDSWLGNNGATTSVWVEDFYPNDAGWPVKLPGSVKSPPFLAQLDEDDGLEIVVIAGVLIYALDPEEPLEPIWTAGPFIMNPDCYAAITPRGSDGFTIPAAGDLTGDGVDEIVVDARDRLLVLDGSDGAVLDEWEHDALGREWQYHPHPVVLADIYPDGHDDSELEIAVQCNDVVNILNFDAYELTLLDSDTLSWTLTSDYFSGWLTAEDLDADGYAEVIHSGTWSEGMMPLVMHSSICIYDHVTGRFGDPEEWEDEYVRGIPAIGSLPSIGLTIAQSSRVNDQNASIHPAVLLDPDSLSNQEGCTTSPTHSDQILCCVMADWLYPFGTADRVLANAENQCFAWDRFGDPDEFYPIGYEEIAGSARPPFPALGELEDEGPLDHADFLVATREGTILAYDDGGDPLDDLGFPYLLPSDLYGGFAVADIDNDGYVEVVFGTMDNYLHVWQLGECDEGYAPWPQCQHDAARTGVLLEE